MNSDFTILLAEDNVHDVTLVKLAMESSGIHNPIQVVRDGLEAIDYLQGNGRYANRTEYPLPKLALLDLKMPRQSGLEVLEWLRHGQSDTLKRLPVIIMSCSDEQSDIDRAYELGVNAYLVKPAAFTEFIEVLKTTTEFWRDTAAHPKI